MDFLRGVVGPKDLTRIITKLYALDKVGPKELARARWLFGEGTVKRLFKTAQQALLETPALIRDVPPDVVVIGDLHGDMHTLLKIIKANGPPPQTNYLFLGDYVDRGANSMEVLMLVLALCLRYPKHVFVLRGNHESALMTKSYGFLRECQHRYSTHMYVAAVACFNVMPIAAIIGKTIFATHGGLSPQLKSVDDIDNIQRPASVLPGTLLCDLMWGDPRKECSQDYMESERGAGYFFGQAACDAFLQRNGFTALIRAHETCKRGCRLHFNNCWTVFSHPRFMGRYNAAGALRVHADGRFEPQMFLYEESDRPHVERWPLNAEDEADLEDQCSCDESVFEFDLSEQEEP